MEVEVEQCGVQVGSGPPRAEHRRSILLSSAHKQTHPSRGIDHHYLTACPSSSAESQLTDASALTAWPFFCFTGRF